MIRDNVSKGLLFYPAVFFRQTHSQGECGEYWVSRTVSSGWGLGGNWGQSFWLVSL